MLNRANISNRCLFFHFTDIFGTFDYFNFLTKILFFYFFNDHFFNLEVKGKFNYSLKMKLLLLYAK